MLRSLNKNIVKKLDSSRKLSLYLGIDCSTQGMKAIVMTERMETKFSTHINFDDDLDYQTEHGVWKQNGEILAPTVMFCAALDLTFSKLKEQGCPFKKLLAISCSGQQHGSVYWKKNSETILQSLNPKKTLESQLQTSFAMKAGPIWMDDSTTEQCKALEKKIGGAIKLAEISGSRGYERFTGNQIAKVFEKKNEVYENTERISLISSFLGCILAGRYIPIDVSDGSGMNLLDISKRIWSNLLLDATAPRLKEKLGNEPCSSETVVGKISNYFVERYKVFSECLIVACSGDNPCSLAGMKVYSAGDVCISLGTSDTLFGVFEEPKPNIIGHILCSPIHKKAYMPLLCFKNGSVVREAIRNQFVQSWDSFNEELLKTPAGNNSQCGFYFLEPEIIPSNLQGIYRFDEKGNPIEHFNSTGEEFRALIEGQFLNIRNHAEKLGLTKSNRIIATGGGSKNKVILQILADVFGAPVYKADLGPETAALGAGLRAIHGYKCHVEKKFISFKEICKNTVGSYKLVCEPNFFNYNIYTKMLPIRNQLEEEITSILRTKIRIIAKF